MSVCTQFQQALVVVFLAAPDQRNSVKVGCPCCDKYCCSGVCCFVFLYYLLLTACHKKLGGSQRSVFGGWPAEKVWESLFSIKKPAHSEKEGGSQRSVFGGSPAEKVWESFFSIKKPHGLRVLGLGLKTQEPWYIGMGTRHMSARSNFGSGQSGIYSGLWISMTWKTWSPMPLLLAIGTPQVLSEII